MENAVLFVLGLLLLGAGLIEVGILIPQHLKDEVNQALQKNEVVVEGNKFYNQRFLNSTHDKAIETYQDFYIYNFTNPLAVIKGYQPIQADEIGPFVFRKYFQRFDITFENDIVTAKTWKWSVYQQDKSNGMDLQTTIICSPDIGFATLVDATRYNATIQAALAQIYPLYAIQCRPANDWFNGYVQMTPLGVPIVFPGYLKNVTSLEQANSTQGFDSWNTGIWDQYQLLNQVQNEGKQADTCWAKAQSIHSSDATQFPLNLQSYYVLRTYISNILRTVSWNYNSRTNVYGLSTYKYLMDQSVFQNSTVNPENAVFYQNGPNGFMNLTSCLGLQLFFSQPHFYGCDPSFGSIFYPPITPDPSEDLATVEIEPNTGFPLSLYIPFLQSRYLAVPTGYEQLYPVKNTLLPILWAGVRAKVSASTANELSSNIYTTQDIADIIYWLGVVAGSFICAVALLIFIRVQFRHRRRKLLLKRSMRQSSRQRLLIDRESTRARRLTAS